ncbi:MAG TPA: protoporphyrinogen oxidase [Phycisphaerae bacterium]|nr:protoporphyrinogen oxidase [Phycisphaerae bacterium]HOJ75365.1 protoporphyrinogen oxidase [Phycisphaerae bacterium]HOM52604.1 protoporphyrinogen oxidase [Phycisphaerae bacterium]HOQ85421.1 protoporphyrinogen oxidase [Phycisphaerae bacterium]HPP27877.1 protoporphyrinogen oxidase [Phycisphaerae bacterium]
MSEESVSYPKRVIVIGGGVTGLAAAHRVVEIAGKTGRAADVLLLEAAPRLGGTIVTTIRDGCLIEGGPDSFITQKPWALALCKRIGIDGELIPTNPACRRTFVVRDGQMHAIPEGFLLLAPSRIWPFVTSRLFSWPGKLRMGLDLILPRKHHGENGDESLASFVLRRFGRESLDRVAQPLVGGIYTADPQYLSLRTTMPRFLEMEAKYRSIIWGMIKGRKAASAAERGDSGARYSMFMSFRRGMTTLIEALAERLPEGAIRTSSPVSRVSRDGTKWRVHLEDGSTESADAVIMACPAHVSARIIRELDPAVADDLAGIRYASSATMTMAFDASAVSNIPDGFGFVVPVVEGRTLIAATFSSIKFPGRAPEGTLLVRAFLGGAMQPHVYDLDDDQLRQAVLQDFRDLIGLRGEPRLVETHRWPASMPQYPVGHLDYVRNLESKVARWPGLAVAGNAFGGVGVPDCVRSAEAAVDRLFNYTLQRAASAPAAVRA